MNSKTLECLAQHWKEPFVGQGVVDLPFDIETFCRDNDKLILQLKKALARQIGDTRRCPKCGHSFIPIDQTSNDGINVLSGFLENDDEPVAD